ncbi:MAG: tRNA 4-thiouridine(8) synthase ThiI [Bacteriovorax sp.]|nr:tRNA 4-thiouridine(8) synthase ThiI [Bacteriovorax sp.]
MTTNSHSNSTFSIVISVDELWLKGRNQKTYLKAAIDHIQAVLKTYHKEKFSFRIQSQRLYYSSHIPFTPESIKALCLVPGLAYISPCKVLPRENQESLENIYSEIINELAYFEHTPKSFRATVRRVDKTFALSSVDVEREIGHRVTMQYPLAKVDLKKPDMIIDVRILNHAISLSTNSYKGIGGLPWGSTGSALTMLSGGFDSPVASVLMAKRGIKQSFVFFHAYPFVGREVLTKIKDLSSVLARYQRQTHLYIVPFGDIQNTIAQNFKEEYRILFFRRFMLELSNRICDRIGADAIITGDCIGQVSSQTMDNLHLMNQVSKRMILRPLIGHNKLEILNAAHLIGTHQISIIPHDDACALFASKNPIIHPNKDYWSAHQNINEELEELLVRALDQCVSYSLNLQGELFKKDFFSFDS